MKALTTYFEQLPAIAKAAGEAYTNVDSIKMYGGDSSQLTGNIVKTNIWLDGIMGLKWKPAE